MRGCKNYWECRILSSACKFPIEEYYDSHGQYREVCTEPIISEWYEISSYFYPEVQGKNCRVRFLAENHAVIGSWFHRPLELPQAKNLETCDSLELEQSADLATVIEANTDKHPEIEEVDLHPIPTIAPSAKDIDTETGLSLTPDQSAALEMMKQFVQQGGRTSGGNLRVPHLQTPRQKYFRLTGYAGTGKSYLIVQLMKWLLNQKINFVAGSPTNKAVKNLKKLAAEAKVSVEAHTVAQLLGQQPELNEETGKEEFITQGTDSIGGYQVALIDEFSMISKSNFKDINQAVWQTQTKIVFVGDEAQLPPVGESEPIVAQSEYIQNEAILSSVVRYDGDIAKAAEEIRSDRIYNQQLYPFQTTPDKTISCLNRDDWLRKAIAYFKSDSYIENPDHVRFLVWRNRTAASLNDYVRSQLWGEDVPEARLT